MKCCPWRPKHMRVSVAPVLNDSHDSLRFSQLLSGGNATSREGTPDLSPSASSKSQKAFEGLDSREDILAYVLQDLSLIKGAQKEMEEEERRLSAKLKEVEQKISDLDQKSSANILLARKIAQVADAAFWVIVIAVALLSIMCIVLTVFTILQDAYNYIIAIIGFIGFSGFLGLAVYLSKLGRMNERIEKLEERIGH